MGIVVDCIMMTSSNGNISCVTDPLCGEFTGHRWIPLTKASGGALMLSLICTSITGCVNNRKAGDLRRDCAHYDVTVMCVAKMALINPGTAKNACLPTQHCSYWCPGVQALCHPYPQCWQNIRCIRRGSHTNITFVSNSIRKRNKILIKITQMAKCQFNLPCTLKGGKSVASCSSVTSTA